MDGTFKGGTLLALYFITAQALAAPDIPSSWEEFKKSSNKEDVANVKKTAKLSWWSLCERFGMLRRSGKNPREFAAIREFLLHDDMLNGKDLLNISTRNVDIGMSQCGVFAAIGSPNSINNTKNTYGKSSQLVYRSPRRYVYTVSTPASPTEIVRSINY